MHVIRIAISAFACAMLAGCAGTGGTSPSYEATHTIDGEDMFPSESLTDWVTYGQQVSVVRVVSELRVQPQPDDTSGYIGRSVHLIVDRNLWVAEGFTPRTELDLIVAGWKTQGGVEVKAALSDFPRVEVGDVLVMPITQDMDGKVTLLSSHAIAAVTANAVDKGAGDDPAVAALNGKSYDQMSAILASTQVDPAAEPYMRLSPYERFQRVGRAQASSAPTASSTR